MNLRGLLQATGVACASAVIAGALLNVQPLRADDGDGDDSRIQRGFEAAPVPLNLHGKNRALVGLGSYIVNVMSECNGCHSAGPQTEFLIGGNPYTGAPAVTNPATYLGGGRDFGPYPSPLSSVHIVSRNLTPDHTGRPIGGDTFDEFRHTIRTGIDPDQLHLNLPPPFHGALLQIMPWPAYAHMSDRELRAIYEYLGAIPCVASPGHVC
ncbi:MAG: CytoChrome c, class [Acidobacteria bacterium]|nr:CytoChrome c, class [Acidobacteriota bacterium]